MRNVLKGMLVAAVAVVGVSLTGVAHATFNEAEYTGNGAPQFNVYTTTDFVGNEKDFLRVGAIGGKFADSKNTTELCDGETQLYVYVHNGAPEDFNGTNNDGTGVAKDTRVKVDIKDNKNISAVISASNATSVTDTTSITCGSDTIKLDYVADSAQNLSAENAKHGISNDIVTNGAVIGTYGNDGVVPGCWDFRNFVTLKVKVTKVPKVTPTVTTPTPTPVTPAKTLVKTGPGDIAGIFVATTLFGAVAHKFVVGRKSSF